MQGKTRWQKLEAAGHVYTHSQKEERDACWSHLHPRPGSREVHAGTQFPLPFVLSPWDGTTSTKGGLQNAFTCTWRYAFEVISNPVKSTMNISYHCAL